MAQHTQPDFVLNNEASTDPDGLPHIETPVIDIQDLEHDARDQTRVSNKGVKIEPRIDGIDERDFAKEDETAIQALEEIERLLRGELHG